MPKLKLTSAAVQRIKAPDQGQVDYFDQAFPAFGFRVGRSGKKVYFVMLRVHGKLARVSLGQAAIGDGPGLTLADARAKAGDVIEQAAQGHDPRQQRAAAKKANQERAKNTFDAFADLYIERYAKKVKRSWKEDQRILDKYARPAWGDRPITAIRKLDVVELLDEVEDGAAAKTGKGHYMANRVLACVRKVFNWAIDERGLLEHNPADRIKKRGHEGSRKRAFTDDEIKAIWDAADKVGGYKGAAVKMLMLTGQRAGVVAGMKHSEVDGDLWLIPGTEMGRSKNKLDHLVPLSRQALEVYRGVERVAQLELEERIAKARHPVEVKLREHVFSSGRRGDKPITIGSKLLADMNEHLEFEGWVFQNLRSLVATRMKRPLMISNAVVNLVQGRLDQSVLAQNYDSNDYIEDKRAALQAWADYLDTIIEGRDGDNVVPIREVADASA